jgi:hypothetical protein
MRSIAKAIAAPPCPNLDASGPTRGIDVLAVKLLATATVSVEVAALPFGVTDAGEKVPVTPDGSPATDRLIALVNGPLRGVREISYWPDDPTVIVCGLFVAAIEKSGTTTAAPEPES